MTLSHCWGRSDVLKLSRDTLQQFCEKVLFDEMPRTFREATIVAKALGIRYLWIDSLCIIQSDEDMSDWTYESGRMEDVYSFSHCNIFTSVSEDSSQGLFRSRNPHSLYSPKLTLTTRGLATDPHSLEFHIQDKHIWDQNVTLGVLNSRGWVFQERMLAPRVLCFSHDQLFWEWRHRRACETYPLQDGSWDYGLESNGRDLRAILELSRGAGKFRDWEYLVEVYSRKNLTNPKDKLVALSGVAKRFAKLTHSTYLAELWLTNMEAQLLWVYRCHLTTKITTEGFPQAYRAPPWSWTSKGGAIDMMSLVRTDRKVFAVEDIVLRHATPNVTGLILGGHLDLRGYLLPMSFDVVRDSLYKGFRMVHTGLPGTRESGYLKTYLDPQPSISGFWKDNSEGKMFYMVAADGHREIIVLFFRAGIETPLFKRIRIGSFEQYLPLTLLGFLLSTLNENEKATLLCLNYEKGLHTIRIV